MIDYMPTDNQFKNDLRIQRDDWAEVLEYINNREYEEAEKKAKKVLNRINESLQD